MKLWGLIQHEVFRLAVGKRMAAVTVLGTLAGIAIIVSGRETLYATEGGLVPYAAPMLLLRSFSVIASLLMVWPLVVGGTLAQDVQTGFAALLLSRAQSRTLWVVSKVAAAGAVSGAAFLIMTVIWAVSARLLAPWETRGIEEMVATAPHLAARAPLIYALLCLGILTLAATSVAALATLAGALIPQPLVSQLSAIFVYIALMIAAPPALNPDSRARPVDYWAEWATLGSHALYCAAAGVVLTACAVLVVSRRYV